MQPRLNIPNISHAVRLLNLTYEDIARRLNVVPDAVSKWFSGEDVPVAHRLLRLSSLLNMSFDDMLVSDAPVLPPPVVAYRKVAGRVTTQLELDQAKAKGQLLRPLARYLPAQFRPPAHPLPSLAYGYIQQAAQDLRANLGISPENPIAYSNLISKFNELGAVIVPVMWGKKELHGNALHILLPESGVTWIYLNLDVNACDFNFWMAHELAHVFTPQCAGLDFGEDFADSFAQAFLFPQSCAAKLYYAIRGHAPGYIVNSIIAAAQSFTISPYTVYKALNAYAKAFQVPGFENLKFYGAVRNFEKSVPLISAILFGQDRPDALTFIQTMKASFRTPFFDILSQYLQEVPEGAGWLAELMEIPILDAKELFNILAPRSQLK